MFWPKIKIKQKVVLIGQKTKKKAKTST